MRILIHHSKAKQLEIADELVEILDGAEISKKQRNVLRTTAISDIDLWLKDAKPTNLVITDSFHYGLMLLARGVTVNWIGWKATSEDMLSAVKKFITEAA